MVRISLDPVKLTMRMTVSVKFCYVLLNVMPYCVFFLLIVVYVTKEIAKKKRVPVQHFVQSRWKIKHRKKGPSNARNPSNTQRLLHSLAVNETDEIVKF